MSSNRGLSVEDLSEPQIRRLVAILQISHPDAVANALALIDTGDNHLDDADMSKLQVDTQSTSSSDAVDMDPASVGDTENIEGGEFLIAPNDSSVSDSPSQEPTGSSAPGTPSQQQDAANAFESNDLMLTNTAQESDGGYVEFTESPSQEGFEVPVIEDVQRRASIPQTSLMVIPEALDEPVVSDIQESEVATEQVSDSIVIVPDVEDGMEGSEALDEPVVSDVKESEVATEQVSDSVVVAPDAEDRMEALEALDGPIASDAQEHDVATEQVSDSVVIVPDVEDRMEKSEALDEPSAAVVQESLVAPDQVNPSFVVPDAEDEKKEAEELDGPIAPVAEESLVETDHVSPSLVVPDAELEESKTPQKRTDNDEAQDTADDEVTSTNPTVEESHENAAVISPVETPEAKSTDDENKTESPPNAEEAVDPVDVTTVDAGDLSADAAADPSIPEIASVDESQPIPDLKETGQVVSMALSNNSESAPSVEVVVADSNTKQKKRPPTKKRPPKPQLASTEAKSDDVVDCLKPVEEEDPAADHELVVNTQDLDVETSDAVSTTPDATETATDSSREQAREVKEDNAEELMPHSEAQTEQLEIEVTLGPTESDMTEVQDCYVDNARLEATKSTVDPPEGDELDTNEHQDEQRDDNDRSIGSIPALSAQPELPANEATVTTEKAEAKATGKKRPPGKMRSDGGNVEIVKDAVTSMDPPGHRNDNAQASGAVTHEIIAWQSDRAEAQPEDTFGCFFDGHAATSNPEDGVTSEDSPEAGCYLLYNSEGGGKLVLHYSKTKVDNAVGFFTPGEGYSIQGFKFTRNHGRVLLIGNCASGLTGRRNYYSGVCQYIRAAKDCNATVWLYPPSDGNGLDIDVYVYLKASLPVSSVLLPENQPCCVSEVEAVACLPKHADFFVNERVAPSKWIEMGNSIGVTIQLPDGKKPVPVSEGLFIPGKSESPRRGASLLSLSPSSEEASVDTTGCYLVYDADGCRLIQHYSKTKVAEAVAFFAPGPGQKIPAFKFKSNQGRSSLIGNCSGGVEGRKRYYSGWCQFVRAAKAVQGNLLLYPRNTLQGGLAVDIYVYTTKPKQGEHQTVKLQDNVNYNVNSIEAVACLPRHAEFFQGLTMDLTRWFEEGSKVGAAIQV